MIDSKKDVPVDGQNRQSSTVNISKQMVERAQRDDITQTITKVNIIIFQLLVCFRCKTERFNK
mgnify:FL=1